MGLVEYLCSQPLRLGHCLLFLFNFVESWKRCEGISHWKASWRSSSVVWWIRKLFLLQLEKEHDGSEIGNLLKSIIREVGLEVRHGR